MQIWHYHHQTGELVSDGLADESPLEPGTYLVPAHATTVKPPEPRTGEARVWNGDEWSYVVDHRGETRWTDHLTSYVVDELGEPEGAIDQPAAPEIPTSDLVADMEVSPYQARVVLHSAGLLPNIDALMASGSIPEEAKIAWEYATTFRRQSPFIISLGAALGLSDGQIDDLFLAASKVV